MKVVWRRALGLLGLALAGVVLVRGPCAPRPTRVLLVGDSITAGISSEPHGPGFAELLPGLLGPGFEVVNVACSGTTTLDWQRDAPGAICGAEGFVRLYETRAHPALPADFATILLGTNDARGALELRAIEPDTFQVALRALAEALHADGAREVMLLSPPTSIVPMPRLARYGAAIQALCGERPHLTCGPDLALLLGEEDFAPHDVHPNAAGHAKIAAALAEALHERAPSPGLGALLAQALLLLACVAIARAYLRARRRARRAAA